MLSSGIVLILVVEGAPPELLLVAQDQVVRENPRQIPRLLPLPSGLRRVRTLEDSHAAETQHVRLINRAAQVRSATL